MFSKLINWIGNLIIISIELLYLLIYISILIISILFSIIPIFINNNKLLKRDKLISAMNNLEEKKENISDLEYLLECNRLMKLYKNVLN